jgi:hypothetical protein
MRKYVLVERSEWRSDRKNGVRFRSPDAKPRVQRAAFQAGSENRAATLYFAIDRA